MPHKHHWKYFKNNTSGRVTKLSVANDVETVVSSIATAGVCVSTSLHGIIFAQAYGVPWVWLNVQDDELKGGEFKFDDFFATVETNKVSRYDVPVADLATLDLEAVAETAALPELTIDLDALEAAFPRNTSGTDEHPPEEFQWSRVPGEERAAAVARVAYRKKQRLARAVRNRLR